MLRFFCVKFDKGSSCLERPHQMRWLQSFRLNKGISGMLAVISANTLFLVLIALALMIFITKNAIAQVAKPQMTLSLQNLTTLPSDAQIRIHPEDGTISYLRGKNLSSILENDQRFQAIQSLGEPEIIAREFLNAYKTLFGVQNPNDEFVLKSVNHDDLGYKHVRFRQIFFNIPIWKAEILVQLNQANHVSLVQGHYIKTPLGFIARATLDKKQALAIVARELGIGSECSDCKLETIIYAPKGRKPLLAFQVAVAISLIEGWLVVIDAKTGLILKKIPAVYSRSAGGL